MEEQCRLRILSWFPLLLLLHCRYARLSLLSSSSHLLVFLLFGHASKTWACRSRRNLSRTVRMIRGDRCSIFVPPSVKGIVSRSNDRRRRSWRSRGRFGSWLRWTGLCNGLGRGHGSGSRGYIVRLFRRRRGHWCRRTFESGCP